MSVRTEGTAQRLPSDVVQRKRRVAPSASVDRSPDAGSGSSSNDDSRWQAYRHVHTAPSLTTAQVRGVTTLDSAPGVLVLGGPTIGLIVINTAVPAPFPIISIRDRDELGGEVAQVTVDPFAPHHKYAAAMCVDGRVVLVSSRPGYLFVRSHDAHVAADRGDAALLPQRVSAVTWTMGLHAPVEQLPTESASSSGSTTPVVRPQPHPLSVNTPRALVTVDEDGAVAVLDPAAATHHVAFRLDPRGNYAGTEATPHDVDMSRRWTSIAVVAFRTVDRSGDGSSDSSTSGSDTPDRGSSNRTSSSQRTRGVVLSRLRSDSPTATEHTSVGVNVVLCNESVVVVVRCQRTAVGNKIVPVEWADGDVRRPACVVVSIAAGDGGLGMSSSPWSSGLTLVSRPLHRVWVVDGAAARIAASLALSDVASGAPFDDGASGFAIAPRIATPPWARSGALNRHIVVYEPPAEQPAGRPTVLLQLAVLHQGGRDPASHWRLEASAWDTLPRPRESAAAAAASRNTMIAVLSACAITDPSTGGAEHRDGAKANPHHIFVPACFVATGTSVLYYQLPGTIAITPLLEAFLRERYGCGTSERQPSNVGGAAPSYLRQAPLGLASAFSAVARDTLAGAATIFAQPPPSGDAGQSGQPYVSAISTAFGTAVQSARAFGAKFAPSDHYNSGDTAGLSGASQAATTVGRTNTKGSSSPEPSSAGTDGAANVNRRQRKQRAVIVYSDPHTAAMMLDSPRTPVAKPHNHHSAAHAMEALDEATDARLTAQDVAITRAFEQRMVSDAEESARAMLTRDEDRQRGAMTGRFLVDQYRIAEEAAVSRRTALTREAAAVRWAQTAERSRTLRPLCDHLEELAANAPFAEERRFAKAVLHQKLNAAAETAAGGDGAPASLASEQSLTALSASDAHSANGSRLRAWPDLIALQERDRKKFDLAELRLAQAAEQRTLEASIVTTFSVYDEWRRRGGPAADAVGDAAWAPCRVQYTLANDNTAVDMASLLKTDDPSWLDPSFTVSTWRYARRWPANPVENDDPAFWFDPLIATDTAIPSEYKVRRRVWSRRQRSAAVEAKLRELKARHASEYAARRRAFFGDAQVDGV